MKGTCAVFPITVLWLFWELLPKSVITQFPPAQEYELSVYSERMRNWFHYQKKKKTDSVRGGRVLSKLNMNDEILNICRDILLLALVSGSSCIMIPDVDDYYNTHQHNICSPASLLGTPIHTPDVWCSSIISRSLGASNHADTNWELRLIFIMFKHGRWCSG